MVASEGGSPRRWPIESVVVVRGGGRNEPVQIELRGEATEALIVADPHFFAALKAASGDRPLRRLGGSPASAPALLALLAFTALLLFAAWRWGVPALAGLAADRVPPAWEREFGAAVADALAPPEERVTDPRVTAPVREVFARLAAHATSRDSFEVVVARARIVNAFAAPGGTIVVTSGLLLALRGPEELAAVLAHEMTHVSARHTVRGLFARLGVRALLALVAGDQSGLASVLGAAGTLGELSYSRRDESAADEGAAELLARAGVDPAALAESLESIARAAGGEREALPGFLSTHPSAAGRGERARALAARLRVVRVAPLPGTEVWRSMREALGAIPTAPGGP